MTKPTAERVRELLRYDPESGVFTWKVDRANGAVKADRIAGSIDAAGYVIIRVDGKSYKAHRLAWLYMTGEWPEKFLDHANEHRADNRWANLREATVSQNGHNVGRYSNNASGHKGVSWNKAGAKWRAHINFNGKRFHLGVFDDIELAALAYAGASRILHGDFSHSTNIVTINNFYGANENGK